MNHIGFRTIRNAQPVRPITPESEK
jgi:hypothetical protein